MAQIADKFGKAGAVNTKLEATIVKTARSTGETVLSCNDVSSFPADTPVYFITYKLVANPTTNTPARENVTSWKGLVNHDNNTITSLTLADGYTDAGNQVGDYVECIPTTKWANDLVDGIQVIHNPDGTLKNKVVECGHINGGTTAGLLKTNASGVVTSAKATADDIDWDSSPKLDDTGWIASTNSNFYYRRYRGVVYLRGYGSLSGSGIVNIFTLPEGFRPSYGNGAAVIQVRDDYAGGAIRWADVNNSGVVRVYRTISGASSIGLGGSFVVD